MQLFRFFFHLLCPNCGSVGFKEVLNIQLHKLINLTSIHRQFYGSITFTVNDARHKRTDKGQLIYPYCSGAKNPQTKEINTTRNGIRQAIIVVCGRCLYFKHAFRSRRICEKVYGVIPTKNARVGILLWAYHLTLFKCSNGTCTLRNYTQCVNGN